MSSVLAAIYTEVDLELEEGEIPPYVHDDRYDDAQSRKEAALRALVIASCREKKNQTNNVPGHVPGTRATHSRN